MRFAIIDSVHPILAEMLRDAGHEVDDLHTQSLESIRKALPSYDGILLRSRVTMDQSMIDACPRLQIIGRVGSGMETIDVSYAESKGITVLSTPEGNAPAVAEHALAMLLALFNNVVKADGEVRQGKWLRKENDGIELGGKTVGIIGFGNTGSQFAKVIGGFDVEVLAYDKYLTDHPHKASMERIFAEADVVSLHLPLTDETDHLVDIDWLNRFKKPIYLINTSRGGVVNTSAVVDALNDGRLLGACLDVLEYETENLQMPALNDLPETARALMNHKKVILSPHVAGLTKESYERLSRVMAEKVLNELS